jgi:hypothetical protein
MLSTQPEYVVTASYGIRPYGSIILPVPASRCLQNGKMRKEQRHLMSHAAHLSTICKGGNVSAARAVAHVQAIEEER